MTCHAHGWKNLAPFIWDDATKILSFAAMLDEEAVDIIVFQKDSSIIACASSNSHISHDAELRLSGMVMRCLNLDFHTGVLLKGSRRAGDEYVRLIEAGAGRLLRAPTLWEDAAKTLFTTNCSWALTRKMCDSLCSEAFSQKTPSGRYPFPGPEVILGHDPDELRQMVPLGYRTEYLLELARTFAADPQLGGIESNSRSYSDAFAQINALKGFGEYATRHLLLLVGYFDRVPIDTVVLGYLKRNHNFRKPEAFIRRHYRKWGKYQWWGLKLEKMLNRQNWLGD